MITQMAGIPRIPPDFNGMEYLINVLKERVCRRHVTLELNGETLTIEQLIQIAEEEWATIPQRTVQSAFRRAHNNVLASLKADGDVGKWVVDELRNRHSEEEEDSDA